MPASPSTALEQVHQAFSGASIKDGNDGKSKKVLEVGVMSRRLRAKTEEANELPSTSLMVPTMNDEDPKMQPDSPGAPSLPAVNPRSAQHKRMLAANKKQAGSEDESESEEETDDEEQSESSGSGRSGSASPIPISSVPQEKVKKSKGAKLGKLAPVGLSASAKNLLKQAETQKSSALGSADSKLNALDGDSPLGALGSIGGSRLAPLGGSSKSLYGDKVPLPPTNTVKSLDDSTSSSSDDSSSDVCQASDRI